jgi:CRISPR/Cas system-associated endonuclease Cas1
MDSDLSGAMIIIEVIPSLEVLLILIWSHRIELSTGFLSLLWQCDIPVRFVQKKHDYVMCKKVHQILNIIILRRHNLYRLLQRLCFSLMAYQISY